MDDAEHAKYCAHARAAIEVGGNLPKRAWTRALLVMHVRTLMVHDWVRRTGFEFFAEEGFRSKTLTCVKNNKEIDVLKLAKKLREKHHLVIDPGYGKIRGKTFRLSNMGDETEETVAHLLSCLNDVL